MIFLAKIKYDERSKIMMTTISPIIALSTLQTVSLIVGVVAIIGVIILKKRSS
jgi:hypothetical protein